MPKPPLHFKFRAGFGSGSAPVSYLLDDYLSGAQLFASRHKLVSDTTYSGALERMRIDTTGQPEADYNVASDGLFVDTAAELAAAGSNSAYVAKIYDQTGLGYHMIADTVSKQYRCINAGVLDTKNSKPCLEAPGTGTYTYRTVGVAGFGGPTTVMVVIAHDGGATNIVWATSGLGSYAYLNGTDIYLRGTGGTSALAAHGVANGTLMLATFVLDGANSSIRVNGVTKNTSNVGELAVSLFMDIGYVGGADLFIQSIGEMLVWGSNLGLTTIAAIEADIMSRWGIA